MPVSRTIDPSDPDLAIRLTQNLVDLYGGAAEQLAVQASKQLDQTLDQVATPSGAQRRLLAAERLRIAAERVRGHLATQLAPSTEQMLLLAAQRGGTEALSELARLGHLTAAQAAEARLALPGAEAVQRLAGSLATRLSGTHLRITRWPVDVYRQITSLAAGDIALGVRTRRQAAQRIWEDFLRRGVTGFVDRSGRAWALESYVDMASRTVVAQAAVEAHLDRLAEAGLDLVIVSDAPQECKLCLVPGTVVEGPAPTGRARSEYTGNVVRIVTASGKDLTGTPDHPVLTPHGWIALKNLAVGDQVISHDRQQGYAGVVPDDVQMPTRIEEAGKAWLPVLLAGPTRRNLDQNLTYRKVRYVSADRDLPPERDPALSQPVADKLLVGGIGATATFFGLDDGKLGLLSLVAAAPRFVSGLDHRGALLGCGLPPPLAHSGAPVGARLRGEPLSLLSGQPYRLDSRSGPHSGAPQVVADYPTADAEGGAELLRALAGKVALDEIVSLNVTEFSGHVWDLSTRPGWFVANGIVTHNCRPWEGEVLTRDGSGARTVEVEHATEDGRMLEVRVAGSVGDAVRDGLLHPNCRHSLSAYQPGVTKAPTNTADPDGDKARQKLRRLERQVRTDKLIAETALTDIAKAAALARVRATQGRIRDHVTATGLIRQPHREQLRLGLRPPRGPTRPAPPPPVAPTPTPTPTPAPAARPIASVEIARADLRQLVVTELERQSSIAPQASTQLRRVSQDWDHTAGPEVLAYFDLNFKQLHLHPDWSSSDGPLHEGVRGSISSGWWTPSGAAGPLQTVVAHEYGHHITTAMFRAITPAGQRRLLETIRDQLGVPVDVDQALGMAPALRHLTAAVQDHPLVVLRVSGYAASNGYELLAEVWQEYSTMGDRARPHIRAIGDVMRDLAEQQQ